MNRSNVGRDRSKLFAMLRAVLVPEVGGREGYLPMTHWSARWSNDRERADDGGEKASMQISSKRRTHNALSNWRHMMPLIRATVQYASMNNAMSQHVSMAGGLLVRLAVPPTSGRAAKERQHRQQALSKRESLFVRPS